jgi:hypothetical protein
LGFYFNGRAIIRYLSAINFYITAKASLKIMWAASLSILKTKESNNMDISKLRQDFKEYFQNRFPDDNQPSTGVSMAFFLQRNEQEFGLNFEDILEKGVIPDSYKIKLENFFTKKGHKKPKTVSCTYVRCLRLLLDFVHNVE